jgi:endonuclease/exonuclease/phosphatase family metal-dependent hydrolase
VDKSDYLLLVGDFNARVGRSDRDVGLWCDVLGHHGIDERNLSGEELLQFCQFNQLSVMNTWFQKRPRDMGTWMHPATKKFHTIDFVLTKSNQRRYFTDVEVVKAANCWTDHLLVKAVVKLNVRRPWYGQRKTYSFRSTQARRSFSAEGLC